MVFQKQPKPLCGKGPAHSMLSLQCIEQLLGHPESIFFSVFQFLCVSTVQTETPLPIPWNNQHRWHCQFLQGDTVIPRGVDKGGDSHPNKPLALTVWCVFPTLQQGHM